MGMGRWRSSGQIHTWTEGDVNGLNGQYDNSLDMQA